MTIIAKDSEIPELPIIEHADIMLCEKEPAERLAFVVVFKYTKPTHSDLANLIYRYRQHFYFDEYDLDNNAENIMKQFLVHYGVDYLHELLDKEIEFVYESDSVTNTSKLTYYLNKKRIVYHFDEKDES